jgi:hypothetical protein
MSLVQQLDAKGLITMSIEGYVNMLISLARPIVDLGRC